MLIVTSTATSPSTLEEEGGGRGTIATIDDNHNDDGGAPMVYEIVTRAADRSSPILSIDSNRISAGPGRRS